MGTILAISSHFTDFNRSLFQRQATVIMTGRPLCRSSSFNPWHPIMLVTAPSSACPFDHPKMIFPDTAPSILSPFLHLRSDLAKQNSPTLRLFCFQIWPTLPKYRLSNLPSDSIIQRTLGDFSDLPTSKANPLIRTAALPGSKPEGLTETLLIPVKLSFCVSFRF